MIGIIMGVGVFVGMLIKLFKVEKKAREKGGKNNGMFDYVISSVLAFLIGAAAWVVVEFIMFIPARQIMFETETKSERISSTEIIALSDTSSTDGHFFLGCGSVGEDEWYVYYTNTKYGYKKNKVSADDMYRPVYLKYIGEGETPRIDEYAQVRREVLKEKSIFLSLIGYIKVAKYEIGDVIDVTYSTRVGTQNADAVRYEIYIPEGSIKEDYNIDME